MSTDTNNKQAPRDWEPHFRRANIRTEDLDACKSTHSKAIKIGHFLSPNVGREVSISVKGRTGKAVLRVTEGRAKEKRYHFEVHWDELDAAASAGSKSGAKKKKVKKTVGSSKAGATKAKKVAEKKTATKTTKTKIAKAAGTKKPAKTKAGGNDEAW